MKWPELAEKLAPFQLERETPFFRLYRRRH